MRWCGITVAALQAADDLGGPADLILIAVPAGEGRLLVASLTGGPAFAPVPRECCRDCGESLAGPSPDGRCGWCQEEFARPPGVGA